MEVVAKKISKVSIFKILYIGFTYSFGIFFVGCGIGALFGFEVVFWEEAPVTGILGLLLAIVMWPIFGFFMAAFMWPFIVFGLWIYSLRKPIGINFKQPIEGSNHQSV
jgi:hypothetical protein